MKKKNIRNLKGFTLIELLAVIVILAVIALIAVPQVLKILNKSRLSAAEDSVYGIVKSAETYVSNFMLQNNGVIPNEELVFSCSGDGCTLQNADNLSNYELDGLEALEFKGTKPKSGTIKISNNGSNIMVSNLNIGSFNCNYPIDENVVCSKNDDIKNNNYVSNNLLVRYNYEDSSNTSSILKDLSGNGNDGQINGATFGDGLVFDGVDDYVAIGKINTPNLTWEVSFKVNIVNSSDNTSVILTNHEGGGCMIRYASSNFISGDCHLNGGYKPVPSSSELNKIYTAIITYDGNVLKFYVDGILKGEYKDNNGIGFPVNNTILMLGADSGGDDGRQAINGFLNGSIYSTRIYDRALNEIEIKYNYEIDKARYKS